jgi:hypothetical protein
MNWAEFRQVRFCQSNSFLATAYDGIDRTVACIEKAQEGNVLPESVLETEDRTDGRRDILEESPEQIVQYVDTSSKQGSGT